MSQFLASKTRLCEERKKYFTLAPQQISKKKHGIISFDIFQRAKTIGDCRVVKVGKKKITVQKTIEYRPETSKIASPDLSQHRYHLLFFDNKPFHHDQLKYSLGVGGVRPV